jgi:hypothetical protein
MAGLESGRPVGVVNASPTEATPSSTAPAPGACALNQSANDVIVRYVSPGLAPSAQLLGDVSIATCGPTVEFIRSTALTDPGFCTSVALASDNPGYDFDAAPALQAVIAAFGPAC